MKKGNRLLAIIFMAMFAVCFSTLGVVFALADTQPSENITPWGDAESGNFGAMTAVATEKFEGEQSFEVKGQTQVRITSPATDGTYYKGTLKVKAAAEETKFQVVDTATSQDTNNGWVYSYLSWDEVTVGTEWTDYTFTMCFRYNGEEKALYSSTDGKTESKTENIATPLAGYDLIFKVSGTVYVDNIKLEKAELPKEPVTTVNITPWGDAENGNFGAMTAVNTEKFEGEQSFELKGETQVRITSPAVDGTLYKGSLKVKAAAEGTTFQVVDTATSQDTAGGWGYTYLAWEQVTVGTEWVEYTFNMSFRYDGAEKVLYSSKDGKNETKKADIATPLAGYDLIFRVSGTVYVDNIKLEAAGVPQRPVQLPDYVVGDTMYTWDFEDGIQGWYGEGGTVVRNTDEEQGVANSGNYAIKTTGVWTRQMNTDPKVAWLTEGYFFEASMYAKAANTSVTTKAVSEMFVWAADSENDNWEMCNTRIKVIPSTEVSGEYSQIKSIFGLYSDGTNSYAYHAVDGKMLLEKLPVGEGKFITYQYALDIGESTAGSVWFDDIVIKKATVNKNAKITVEGYENVTLVVSQNGTELATQPTIVNDGNVYTIKDLAFEKFNTTYQVTVKANGETVKTVDVDFVNSEKNIGKEYNATVTVKNEAGELITNATIAVNGQTVTENVEGVYTITGLDTDVEAVVSSESYIDKKVVLTATNKDVEIVMLTAKEEIVVDGNIMNGNMENGFTYPNYNSKGVAYEVTTDDRYDGSRSLKLAASGAGAVHNVRMDTPGNVNGTAYYFELMVKGATEGTITLGAGLTGKNTVGDWVTQYIKGADVQLTTEWQKVAITYAFNFDELAKEVYTSVNGAESVVSNYEFASVEALDLNIYLTDGAVVYVDNIVVLETYTATVIVKDDEGNAAANATFEVVDYAGNTQAVTPVYDDETKTYTFAGFKGTVKVIAKLGEKTYAPVTVSKALNVVTIEEAYTVVVTLKDQFGEFVKGATVVARKGITNVGEFTDNGDGTYTYAGAMGQITLIITVEGYSFEKVNVSISNATLTVTGEKEVEDTPTTSDSQTNACGGYVGASLYSVIAFIGFALLAKKKN